MNIIAVDDEMHALHNLSKAIKLAEPSASITTFNFSEDAIEYAKSNIVNVAFLDIEMVEMNGLVLAKNLKEIHGETNIIFVTGHSSYMESAFDMHVSGYLLKPVDAERIADELSDLRNPVKKPDVGIRVQCFGNFEVFKDGKPVPFSRSKSKELFAYLVNQMGEGVSKKELAAILWEDKEYTRGVQANLHTLTSEMIRSLENVGAKDIIVHKRNLYAVDPTKFSCDYYNYIEGNAVAVNSYRGEYMTNYSWAEFTAGMLVGHSL